MSALHACGHLVGNCPTCHQCLINDGVDRCATCEPARRVYILERVEGRWKLTLPKDSRIAKLAMLVPIRWLFIESARIGTDTTSYISIGSMRSQRGATNVQQSD